MTDPTGDRVPDAGSSGPDDRPDLQPDASAPGVADVPGTSAQPAGGDDAHPTTDRVTPSPESPQAPAAEPSSDSPPEAPTAAAGEDDALSTPLDVAHDVGGSAPDEGPTDVGAPAPPTAETAAAAAGPAEPPPADPPRPTSDQDVPDASAETDAPATADPASTPRAAPAPPPVPRAAVGPLAAAAAAVPPAGAVDPVVAVPAAPVAPVAPVPLSASDTGAEPEVPHATHDDEPQEETAPRSGSRIGRVPAAALVVLALLAVLGTGYLAWQWREEARTDDARSEGIEAARDAARVLFSYNHEQLEQDFERGLDVTTGDFREEYERTTREVVTPVATQYDAVVEAEVVESAVVSASPERLVALIYVNQTTTSTRVEGPKIDQSRVRMSLRKDDGEWLVERVDAL